MLERTDAITNEVLEQITLVLAYRSLFVFKIRMLCFVTGRIFYVYIYIYIYIYIYMFFGVVFFADSHSSLGINVTVTERASRRNGCMYSFHEFCNAQNP